MDEKYLYLVDLWEQWKSEILKIVPADNKYFCLKQGISESDIAMYSKSKNGFAIPDELIAFYQVYDVRYNEVSSAISFYVNDWEYNLLPFKMINQNWESLQQLQFGESIEEENLENFSDKVIAQDYTNPRWIPFAEGKNGDYLLYDTEPSEHGDFGQIIELQNESWERNVIASCLTDLIRNEIRGLQNGAAGRFDFTLGKED